MTIQTLGNIALIIVLIGWIGFRQLTWQAVAVSRMWRLPIILGAVGLFTLAKGSDITSLKMIDVAVLVIELVISLGIGAAMGRLATFRRMSETTLADYRRRNTGHETGAVMESRTGWLGLALWVAFLVIRIGMDVGAGALGSTLASSTGVILVMVAANRLSRTAVFAARISRLDGVTA